MTAILRVSDPTETQEITREPISKEVDHARRRRPSETAAIEMSSKEEGRDRFT